MKSKYIITITLLLFSFINEILNDAVELAVEHQDGPTRNKSWGVLTFEQGNKVMKNGSSNREAEDDEPTAHIMLLAIVAFICPDSFLHVNRLVGQPNVNDKYFNVTVNPRVLDNVRDVNLSLQMSTNVTIGLDPTVGEVSDLGGNTYLIQGRGSISRLEFGVYGTPGVPFPQIQSIKFNGRAVCLNMREWDPRESRPVPRAVSSALIAPTRYIPRCGRKLVEHTPLVTNGASTMPGDWPWHVAMFVRTTKHGPSTYQCGGTVVSRAAVLSASHCVSLGSILISPDQMTLIMGKYNLHEDDERSINYTVERILPHPQYDFDTLRNDFAIIFPTKDIVFNNFVQPICLWDQRQIERKILYGEFGSVVGWGAAKGGELSGQLKTGRMRVVPDQNCLNSQPQFFSRFLNVNSFCAGNDGPDNLTSACNGDSGGAFAFPITMADGRVSWFLRGVISLSVARDQNRGCHPRDNILIADAASQADWMYNQTGVEPYNDTSPAKDYPYARIPKRNVSAVPVDLAEHLSIRANEKNPFD